MNVKFRLVASFTLLASLFAITLTAAAQDFDYQPIATEEFRAVWERTDLPVAETRVPRTWIWGPGGYTGLLQEPYAEAPDGKRAVQYFDKSRMELPWNDVDPASPWFVTQGLLAMELMTGKLQLGDATFEQYRPAEIPVAGDPGDRTGPTYAAMGGFISWDPRPTGGVITQVMDREGNITDDPRLANYGVTDDFFDEVTGHNIASVFWRFMTSDSVIYEDGRFVEGPLFLDSLYAVGRPVTEAYWAWVTVAGIDQDVLIQCFERRCLTFTPGNPQGWQVESGNVGQHYFHWRYHLITLPIVVPPIAPPVAPPAIIKIDPVHAENKVSTDHTVKATLVDKHHKAIGKDIAVKLEVLKGPNASTVLEGVTDAHGQVYFTWTSDTPGTDEFRVFVVSHPDIHATGTKT